MDELVQIYRKMDECYCKVMRGTFTDKQKSLNDCRDELLESHSDPLCVLEIQRGIHERMLDGAIHSNQSPKICLDLFDDLQKVTSPNPNPIGRWPLIFILSQYLCSKECEHQSVGRAKLNEVLEELRNARDASISAISYTEKFLAAEDEKK